MDNANSYWRRTAKGGAELLASRCNGCLTYYLPRVAICGACRGEAFDLVPLAAEGRLYAFTLVHVPPPGYPSPYAIGYVDFPEGVRVFGHVSLETGIPLRCDAPVGVEVVTLRRDRDADPVEGYRFVPRDAAEAALR